MTDSADLIRQRFDTLEPVLDEQARRRFAAAEAYPAGIKVSDADMAALAIAATLSMVTGTTRCGRAQLIGAIVYAGCLSRLIWHKFMAINSV